MMRRIALAAAASLAAAVVIQGARHYRWQRAVLAEHKRSGSPWKR